jgi:hypothetical protein
VSHIGASYGHVVLLTGIYHSILELCRQLQDATFASLFRSKDLLEPYYHALSTEKDIILLPAFLFTLYLLMLDRRTARQLITFGLLSKLGQVLHAFPDVTQYSTMHHTHEQYLDGMLIPLERVSNASVQRQVGCIFFVIHM